MGKFWNWLNGVGDPLEAEGITAQPPVITQGGLQYEAKILHAKYRLDAIKRTVDQSEGKLSAKHLEEFRAEIRDHAHTLASAGIITDDEAAAIVKHGKGATL